eukprot:CAMPEP_0172307574 /NCGR_PEP_ID=MMETSP1058-20130122/8402_1 /TAXON_ID=83371 /ORGANISM="Detonula confervacea, Strain CCMP 353" /LENGTH=437 /DNA_ID=CAMNT_0013019779 /DNA_START=45 /DNA_END=1358 /DNA_ORIENTATION=+
MDDTTGSSSQEQNTNSDDMGSQEHTTTSNETAIAALSSDRPYVNHTYRDFSLYLQQGLPIIDHKKAGSNFPAKLHQMLSEPHFSHIIGWMPHGRAFKIMNKDLLVNQAIPAFFVQTKFESFTRQLSGWGFKRLHQRGADYGCYYHECFLRDMSQLTWLMKRLPSNQGKPTPFAGGEPKFYLISMLRPLPPPTMTWDRKYSSDPMVASQAAAVPHILALAYNFSNIAQNAMMPVAQLDSSQTPAAAATMLPITSMPPTHSHDTSSWNSVALASSASAAVAATNMPSLSAPTSAFAQTNYLSPYQMANAVHLQDARMLSTQTSPAVPTTAVISEIEMASSAFINNQTSCEYTNNVQYISSHEPSEHSNQTNPTSSSNPTDSASTNPQYKQESTTSSSSACQQENVDRAQEFCPEEKYEYHSDTDSFKDDLTSYLESFQF